jgi:hypothetical protein
MALTSGFKKFVGLLVTVAVVGSGVYAYKNNHSLGPKANEAVVTTPQPNVYVVQGSPTPHVTPERMADPVTNPIQPPPEPVQSSDASADRGLNAVLQAGNRK